MEDALSLVLREQARRQALRLDEERQLGDIKAVISRQYIFSGHKRHVVRVTDVVHFVCTELGLNDNNQAFLLVRRAATELGGVLVMRVNQRLVRGCYENTGQTDAEATELSRFIRAAPDAKQPKRSNDDKRPYWRRRAGKK